jgi:hypothetical protein
MHGYALSTVCFILAQSALLNDVPVLIKHYRVKFQSRRNRNRQICRRYVFMATGRQVLYWVSRSAINPINLAKSILFKLLTIYLGKACSSIISFIALWVFLFYWNYSEYDLTSNGTEPVETVSISTIL